MTSIFEVVLNSPLAEKRRIFNRAKNGKLKIKKDELMKVDYCFPSLLEVIDGPTEELYKSISFLAIPYPPENTPIAFL